MEEAVTETGPKSSRIWVMYLFYGIFSLGSFWWFYRMEATSPSTNIMTAQQQIIGVGVMLLSPLIATPILNLLMKDTSQKVPPFWQVLKYTLLFGVPTMVAIWLFALFAVEQPMEEAYDRALFGCFSIIIFMPSVTSIIARATGLQTMFALEKAIWRTMPACGAISILSGILFASH